MSISLWAAYLGAVTFLALTPGPNGLLAMAHGVSFGVSKSLFTILGGVFGFIILMLVSTLGIGALLVASPKLFFLMKVAGAGYLLFLGVKQFANSSNLSFDGTLETDMPSSFSLFRHGFYVALSNPKVILFYLSFLPQFIDSKVSFPLQIAILAITFAVVEFLVEFILSAFSRTASTILKNDKVLDFVNKSIGVVFIGISIIFFLSALGVFA